MRKLSVLLLTIFACSFIAKAQNAETKADDYARIALHTAIPNIADMPEAAKKMLKNKIDQVATNTGVGGGSKNPRFIITANVSVLTKDITPTAPPMTAITIDVTFFVGDAQTMTKYSSASIQAKGVGTNETKAYIEAIKAIRTNAPELKNMVETGKKKILEYYNSQCDFIIKKAETLAGQSKFDEAIFELSSIPDVCKDCYNKSMNAVGPIYKKYIDKACKEKLNAAKGVWAGAQNWDGAQQVSQILGTVDPEAACIGEVQSFIAEVKQKIKEMDQRDWDFKMKVFDASVDLEKQRIEAARQVGVAFGENQPDQEVNIVGWK